MQHFNPSSPAFSRMSRRSPSQKGGGWMVLGLIGVLVLANQNRAEGGQIAYIAEIDETYELFVADADFNESHPITENDILELEPDWSPDGRQIVFTGLYSEGGQDLYQIDADGGNLINLTNAPAEEGGPRWMPVCPPELNPCEPWIVFHSDVDGDFDLYAAPLSNMQDPVQLTFEDSDDRWGHWSGDGTKIVFMSDRAHGTYDIFVLDLFSAEVFQYTDTPDVDDVYPTWSPDGRTIAWVSGDFFNFRIMLMDAACTTVCGTNQRLLLPQFNTNDELFVEEWDPGFSADSQWMVFTSNRDLASEDPIFPIGFDYEIFRVRLDGGDLTQLTENETDDFTPDWYAPLR